MGDYKGPVRILPQPSAYPGHTVWGSQTGPVCFLGYVEQPFGNDPGIAVFINDRELRQLVLARRWPTPEERDRLQAHIDDLEGLVEMLTQERDDAVANQQTVVPVREVAAMVAAAQRPVLHAQPTTKEE